MAVQFQKEEVESLIGVAMDFNRYSDLNACLTQDLIAYARALRVQAMRSRISKNYKSLRQAKKVIAWVLTHLASRRKAACS